MPSVVADRKGVAGIGREAHLGCARQRSVRQAAMENGADMGRGRVGRQVELNRDALPLSIRVRRDAVARNVTGQDWYWIHADIGVGRPEPPLKPRRETTR